MQRLVIVILWLSVGRLVFANDSQDPLASVYGALPDVHSAAISPDGAQYALIKRGTQGYLLVIVEIESGDVVREVDTHAQQVEFLSSNLLLLRSQQIIIAQDKHPNRLLYSRHGHVSHAYAIYDLKAGEVRDLSRHHRPMLDGSYSQVSLIGLSAARQRGVFKVQWQYLPSERRFGISPTDLFTIDLINGNWEEESAGSKYMRNWFYDQAGILIASEEYRPRTGEQIIWAISDDEKKVVYEANTAADMINDPMVSPDGRELVFARWHEGWRHIFALNLNSGEMSGPLFEDSGRSVVRIEVGPGRDFRGATFGGIDRRQRWLQPELQSRYSLMASRYQRTTVSLVSFSEDFTKAIFRLEGTGGAGRYVLYDASTDQELTLGAEYNVDTIAAIEPFSYQSADGMQIEAVVTHPLNMAGNKPAPLIVLAGLNASPAYLAFDWMAQYLAARGYRVLRANVRGTEGFGRAYRDAGIGEWGGRMQDDLDAGVAAMVAAKLADPERVCILGQGYGGYAALAGGAFSAPLYRCVIAIAPVSDLSVMLAHFRNNKNSRSWQIAPQLDLMLEADYGKKRLAQLSPGNAARSFAAPVLLIHDREDRIVPVKHSVMMEKSLKKAGKPVIVVRLHGTIHELDAGEARSTILSAIGVFLDVYNPAD